MTRHWAEVRPMEEQGLWLVTTIVELAELLDEQHNEADFGSALAARLAKRLAPAEFSLLIVANAGDVTVAGASSETVNGLAALQVKLMEGPGIECHQTGMPVLNTAITTADKRWPRFAPAAVEVGVGIVTALPMRRRKQAFGALFGASASNHQLSDTDLQELRVLARIAPLAMARQRDLRRSILAAEQLQRALDSRVLIEQAKGAVAARLGTSPDRAFELLRKYARRENMTLAEVSSQAIKDTLSPHDLMAVAQAQRAGRLRASHAPHS